MKILELKLSVKIYIKKQITIIAILQSAVRLILFITLKFKYIHINKPIKPVSINNLRYPLSKIKPVSPNELLNPNNEYPYLVKYKYVYSTLPLSNDVPFKTPILFNNGVR